MAQTSENFNFILPSRDTDDIVDVNQISDNFRIIDKKLYEATQNASKEYVDNAIDALEDDVAYLSTHAATKQYVDDAVASSGSVSQEYVDNEIETLRHEVVTIDRIEPLEADVETIKQGYVSVEYVNEKTKNIPAIEEDIETLKDDAETFKENFEVISTSYATKKYVDDAIASSGGGTGGGGVSSWNDLTDKPFYDEGTKTLTLDYANPPAVGIDLMGDVLYKVTDDILTEADINGANISLSGTIGGIDTTFSQELNVDTAEAAVSFPFGMVYQFNYEVNGTTVAVTIGAVTQTGAFEEFGMSFNIPETGTYIAYSFLSGEGTINSISLERDGELKTLDIKFIPNELYTEIDQRIENYINEALGGEY